MNEIEEQRVIEALRAITGGLTVTEHDIIDAGTRLQHNLKATPPRRNRALLAVAAAVVLIVGIVAFQVVAGNDDGSQKPAPATPSSPAEKLADALAANAYAPFVDDFTAGAPPTARDLSGVWMLRTPYQGSLVVNGGLDWSHESLRQESVASSTLNDGTWTRNLDGGFCSGEAISGLPWTASIADDGSLHLLLNRASATCTPADNYEVWDRLAPGPSPVLDYVRETSGEIDWVAGTDELEGLFINTETGHVLEVALNGRYWYHDSVTGQEFIPSDEGTLDSEAGAGTVAGTCDGGNFSTTFEVGATQAVPDLLPSSTVLRIGASGAACSPGIGTGGVWLKFY